MFWLSSTKNEPRSIKLIGLDVPRTPMRAREAKALFAPTRVVATIIIVRMRLLIPSSIEGNIGYCCLLLVLQLDPRSLKRGPACLPTTTSLHMDVVGRKAVCTSCTAVVRRTMDFDLASGRLAGESTQ